MHHVRHQDDRDCQVCQDAVRLLDQRQQTKLCDKEVRDAADKRGKDLGAADFACGFCSAASFSETGVDRLTMAATMLTAVDTAPRMISTEISGVMNLLPTPC